MKTFKEFINESLRDKMTGPSNEKIKKSLEELSDSDKIKSIIKNQLPYELLPDNLTVKGNLVCSHNQLTELPDNLTVKGNLVCSYNKLTELPDNLTVDGDLDCSHNQLTELPDNLSVDGDLICYNNPLPKDIKKPKGVKREMIK